MKFKVFLFLLFFITGSIAKTIVIGDSLADGIGICYTQKFGGDYKSVPSSGLINRKFFNWNDYVIKTDLKNYDYVVIVLGTNDFMPIKGNNTSSVVWADEYSKRINTFTSLIRNNNKDIKIIWVLPSNLKNESNNKDLRGVSVTINSNKDLLDYKIVDIQEEIGYNYTKYYNGKQIRTNDGIHYKKYLSCLISDKIREVQ